MCFTPRQIDNRINKLIALENEKKDLESRIARIKEELQADMQDAEYVTGDKYHVNWTWYETARFDAKGFSKQFPEVAAAWTKKSRSRRFSWAAN